MMRRSVRFLGPGQVDVVDEPLPIPGPGQVLVASIVSAISAGTELLVYRGQAPAELAVDETIPALAGSFRYPLKYGYAVAGRVADVGAGVPAGWLGRLVFAFQPHTSHFVARPEDLVVVDAAPDTAVMLPFVETAVNFLLDGAPLVGERVVVVGQGVVGLLTTALLARYPLAELVAIEPLAERRAWAHRLGAHVVVDPEAALAEVQARPDDDRADLCYELSGNPQALDMAIEATGYAGRLIIGSWYGAKPVTLVLGGRFHRSKMRLLASQVSRVAPALSGRWTTRRRLHVAASLLPTLQPERLITHSIPLVAAADAYRLLADQRDAALQVVLTY